MIIQGLLAVVSPSCLIWIIFGTIVGIIFGAIPGLTATMAIVMFIPVTYSLPAATSIALLMSLYIGGISGGLIPPILLNIPGTPASIATCFDGHPMALKGQGAQALGYGVVFSFVGTMLSVVALVLISPLLAALAIKFGPFEYAAVTIFSLSLIITLSAKNLGKGVICGILGLMFGTVGMAPIDSVTRFTFGSVNLRSGFDILTVLVGLYAIPEILEVAEKSRSPKELEIQSIGKIKIKGFGFSLKEFLAQIPNAIRSSLIGIGLGILPGIGNGTSNILSYSVAKNQSKYPEKFGTGVPDGIVATEAANNATIGGTIIPLLTLGIPGDSTAALLLGALIINGITPGPLIFQQSGYVVYAIYFAMIISSILMLFFEMFGINFFVRILNIPKHYLFPAVFVLCAIGAFGLNNRLFDILILIGFGLIGYFLKKTEYPLPPLLLGFVLGPIFELNFRRALSYSNGSLAPFFMRPISLMFILFTFISIAYVVLKNKKVKS
ncbi:MAG: tripartite tricarboxylate transporter permease [Sphaerochaetaceae bacterium]